MRRFWFEKIDRNLWFFDRWRDLRCWWWRVMPHRYRPLWDDGEQDDWCRFCERFDGHVE